MSGEIIVSIEAPEWRKVLPDAEDVARSAARAALREGRPDTGPGGTELGIVLADDETLRRLNRDYRGHDRPTNILAFEQSPPAASDAGACHLLGDVFVSLGAAAREAAEQNKLLADHLTHLVVHGVLHLCGDGHAAPEEAAGMEARERFILARLGVADPYEAMDAAPAG